MNQKRILIPLPLYGFDPSEVAIPWKLLSEKKFQVIFSTPNGKKANGDELMLSGDKLGIFKSVLRARKDAVETYDKMVNDDSFCNPIKYNEAQERNFDAILLPGGHDKGVKEYLESKILQKLVVDFFNAKKTVGAICHGVVLAARSVNSENNKSIISNYKTTALLKSQELLAYNLTKLWLKDYYLTYPGNTVEDEVKSVLFDKDQFIKGPSPILRDDLDHLNRGFIVKDRNYISARWPGDAYRFSLEFIKMIQDTSN